MPEVYTLQDLRALVDGYAEYLRANALKPLTVSTATEHSARFVRWLGGDYRPRNAAPRIAADERRRSAWTPTDLEQELEAYRRELVAARLKPLALSAYLRGTDYFIRWIDGRYETRGPNAGGGTRARPEGDDAWLDESEIQRQLVRWMQTHGWEIIRQASGREHGTDIDALRDGVRLSVEVKGHPRRIHTFGANKGNPRKWHPAAQARAYFGGALHSAVTMIHSDPDRRVAVAFPDIPVYRGLVNRSVTGLDRMGITIWFVDRGGNVSEPPSGATR